MPAPPCLDRHREQEQAITTNNNKDMKTIIQKYENIYSFVDQIDNAPTSKLFDGKYLASDDTDADFCGTPDFATAHNLLLNGDAQAAARVNTEYKKILAKTKKNRPRPCPAIVGHTPIVGAFLAGDPVCMLTKKNRPTKARVITIIYNTSVSCKIRATDMAKAGANLLAAINNIEANGVRVNLYVSEVSRTSDRYDERLVIGMKIKTDCQPLNIMQIAYPIANPSFLRRHCFKVCETTKGLKSDIWTRKYGYPVHGAQAEKLISEANIKYDAYLDFNDTFGTDPADIVTKILANVK